MFWKSLFVNTIGGCILAISAGSYLLKLTSNVHFIKREGIKQPEFVLRDLIGASPQELGSGSGPGVSVPSPVVSSPDPSPGHTPGPGEVKEVQKAKDAGGAEQAAQESKASPGPSEPSNEVVTEHQQKPNAIATTKEQTEGTTVVSGEKPGKPTTKQPEAVTAKDGGTPSSGVEDKSQDPSTPATSNNDSQQVQVPSTPTTGGNVTQEKAASMGEGSGGGVQKEQVSTAQNSTNESAIGHSAPSVSTATDGAQKIDAPVTSTTTGGTQQNLQNSNAGNSGDRASSETANNAQSTPATTVGTPRVPSMPVAGGSGKQATTVPAPTEGKQQTKTPPVQPPGVAPKPQAPAAHTAAKPTANKKGRGKGGGGKTPGGTKSSGPGGKPWVRARGWSGGGSSRKVKPPENSWLQKGKQKA